MFAAGAAENVPVRRLVANISKYIQENPKDAQGYYMLARVHSLAVTRSFISTAAERSSGIDPKKRKPAENSRPHLSKPERVIYAAPAEKPGKDGKAKLPTLFGDSHLEERHSKLAIASEDLWHLKQSVRNFTLATQMAPTKGIYWLGLGWMYEQGAPFASRLGKPWIGNANSSSASRSEWLSRALLCYRQAYAHGTGQSTMSQSAEFYHLQVEAADSIIRIQKLRGSALSPDDKAEQQKLRTKIKQLGRGSWAVTPIILPLGHDTAFKSLTISHNSVSFDLAGDGVKRHWPWVSFDTGILVWDPNSTGKITSGRQLFGSVTWWVFWKNGYAALAALDNNRDGVLSGSELKGIAIWRDANSNGISESGEVKPIANWGIISLAIKETERVDGMPSNLRGATKVDGTILPTYDWTPRSLN